MLAKAIADLGRGPHQHRRPVSDLKLPTFTGAATEWLPFKKIYQRTRLSYEPIENISRLLTALSGNAREAVATLASASDDPDDIILELDRRFGRPELIVRQLVSEITSHPRLTYSCESLNAFACKLRNCLQTMHLLNHREFMTSPELTDAVLSKLTPLQKARWVDFADHQSYIEPHLSKLELLDHFVTREADINLRFGPTDTSKSLARQHFIDESYDEDEADCHNLNPKKVGTEKDCGYCHDPTHDLANCGKFVTLSIDDRWRWVSENKTCRKCLNKGSHRYINCRAKCEIKGCGRPHHALLHQNDPAPQTSAHVDVINEPDQSVSTSTADGNDTHEEPVTVAHASPAEQPEPLVLRPLLKVIPVTVFGPRGNLDTFALLDDGSTATLIDQSIANAVGADGPKSSLRINCIGGLSRQTEIKYVDVEISGRHSETKHLLRHARAIPYLGIATQSVQQADINRFEHLKDVVQELCYGDAQPMLIIGTDNWHLTLPQATRRGTRNEPVAVLTALGWVLYGFPSSKTKVIESVNNIFTIDMNKDEASHREVERLIKDYYKLDSIGITKNTYVCPDDKHALDILDTTTRRLPTGRFETGLLWKPNISNIPNSCKLALSRFLSLEKKLNSGDQALRESYKNNVESMISKGYAEPCIEKPNPEYINWYLPHFGVVHPQKKKLRVVHDAAARCQGVSLNSMLLSGPDLLQPLLGILMKFREGRVALNADIREMFPQIKIIPRDRDAQRFLWRADPSLPITEFRMSSMMFGATCSPCAAIYIKNKNAEEHRSSFPAAAEAIVKNHYMDDLLISVDNVAEAAKLAADIIEVHSRACFEMRAWVSNVKEALSLLPPELCANSVSEVGLSSPTKSVRVLGMAWNVTEDTLCFSRGHLNVDPKLTKRSILSQLMKVYDPLGLLTPITIKGRILFQSIWRTGASWDDELPQEFKYKWLRWVEELGQMAQGNVPRCYFSQLDPIERHLHLFCDASEHAYATVAYWRFTYSDSTVKMSLIGGKARLAPIKPVSIPRLELQAALIASRFACYIVEQHEHKPLTITLWTDSLTVLKWLRSNAATFKPFVAYRVSEITEITDVENWRYVPTKLNVADDATRTNSKFEINSRWFSGPSFLVQPPQTWPEEPSKLAPLSRDELKHSNETVGQLNINPKLLGLLSPVVADHSRFSEWQRLLRATARTHACVRTFRSIQKSSNNKNSKFTIDTKSKTCINLLPLLAEDMKKAELHLLRRSQLDSFNEEMEILRNGSQVPKSSRIGRVVTFLDENELLRLTSRTSHTETLLPSQERFPIILDGKHHITELIIQAHHKRCAHGNTETVVSELRQRFYIIPLRPSVKRVTSKCQLCRIKKALPSTPPFGDLPEGRLAHHTRPFTHTGLDYFGPTLVTSGRRTMKRWVALFTCLTIRAVHLEIVENLTSDSAIMALRRFISRRGCPARIYSDNGTAFVGAARQLHELYNFAADNKIEWSFIPPLAPSMGGCWERLVRSVKTALRVTLHQRAPREEILHTLLLEAEALINNRPLTHVPVDPDTETPLTPSHFLLGGPSRDPPTAVLDDADLHRRVEWRKGLRLADHFWERWTKEYMPTLFPRRAGAIPHVFKIGDVVVVADGSLPRGAWPVGRVTRTWPGPDGVVRVVELKTSTGTLKRATKMIAPLEV